MPLRSYALMKPAPSSARLSIGSSVRSNVGSPVRFWKSAITTETGSCATGGGGGRRYHQMPDESATSSKLIATATGSPTNALDRDQLALIVEAIEIGLQLRRRLITAGRIGGETAGNDAVERFRNRRIEDFSDTGAASRRFCSSASAVGAPSRRFRPSNVSRRIKPKA